MTPLEVVTIAERIGGIHRTVRSGPSVLSLTFGSQELCEALIGSFSQTEDVNVDARLVFLTTREVDFAELLADLPPQHAVSITDDVYILSLIGPPRMIYILDRRRRSGVVWTSGSVLPPWEVSRPGLPCLLGLWSRTPWLPVHGASVGWGGRHVLLAGPGKAGKTTAALACALSGWSYAGDDSVAIHTAGQAAVLPVFASARLRADMIRHFPGSLTMHSAITDDDGDVRRELQLPYLLPNSSFSGGVLAAVLIPRRRGATKPEITRARHIDAVHALLVPSQVPGWRKHITDRLMAFAGQLPVYFIDTGQGIEEIPKTLEEFLAAGPERLEKEPRAA